MATRTRKANPLTVIKRHLKQIKLTMEGHQKQKALLEDAQAQLNKINEELPTLESDVKTLTEAAMYLSAVDIGVLDNDAENDADIQELVTSILLQEEKIKMQKEADKLAQAA